MSKTKRTKKAAGSNNIESMLREDRVFKPSKEFSKQAHIGSMAQYKKLYKRSIDDPEGFWADKASGFSWKKKWDKTLEWNFDEPKVKWFIGGKMNITENCIDRHLEERGDQVAILWEPNDPKEDHIKITYKELHSRVNAFANVLKRNGASKRDRICLYMPMTPELAIATLACARIGAMHSVVFAGFSARSLEDRINDASCNLIVTADGGYRGSKVIELKKIVDLALVNCPSIEKSIVLKRTGCEVEMK
ncbi:MAG: AMP-binding protein, partial [Verrucomicrobia bacterium]|nr:AMP-binding protein [Verrucomicrobiota bacterium]